MYRTLVAIMCVGTALSAPQDSNITYVKRQAEPLPPESIPIKPSRESRIELLPLTIPNIESEKENLTKKHKNNQDNATYNYSDRIYSIKTKPKKDNRSKIPEGITPNVTTAITTIENTIPSTSTTEENIPVVIEQDAEPTEIADESDIKSTDIIPAESILTDSYAKNETQYDTITESDELATEKYEEITENTVDTVVYEDTTTTKSPVPRYFPKLSHYGKSSYESFSQNLIGPSGKRRFRSKCRCEKIWNCTKLQISVARCPDEYFLCCS